MGVLLLASGGALLHQSGDRMRLAGDPVPPDPGIGEYRGMVVVLRAPLQGVRQRLSSILINNPNLDVPLRQITLQTAASLELFAHDAPGGLVLAPNTRITLGPFNNGPLRFSQLDVLGIGTLWVTAVTY